MVQIHLKAASIPNRDQQAVDKAPGEEGERRKT
jgi:hypothetical protein